VAKECSIKASEIAENPFEFDRINVCSVQPLGLVAAVLPHRVIRSFCAVSTL
jgi:hypothetical protein